MCALNLVFLVCDTLRLKSNSWSQIFHCQNTFKYLWLVLTRCVNNYNLLLSNQYLQPSPSHHALLATSACQWGFLNPYQLKPNSTQQPKTWERNSQHWLVFGNLWRFNFLLLTSPSCLLWSWPCCLCFRVIFLACLLEASQQDELGGIPESEFNKLWT